jgi:Flp pilus assembly protein TadB
MNSLSSSTLPRLLSIPERAAPRRRRASSALSTKEIFHRKSGEDFKEFQPYCCAGGDSAGVSSVPAGASVLAAGASVAAGLVTSVVAGGGVVGVGLVAGATVSVFCSQAARSAAPARMQMYFFIVGNAHCFSTSIAASAVFGPRRMLLKTQMARHEH